ncbi:hypothetical protein ACLMJK_009547 [Lecanora helva]
MPIRAQLLGKVVAKLNGLNVSQPKMESLLPQLLAFPPQPPPPTPLSDAEYDKQIKALNALLNTTSPSKLLAGVSGSENLLDILDPRNNTVPYLYTLLAAITVPGDKQKGASISRSFKPDSPLWLKVNAFMMQFDTIQIRYVGLQFRTLIDAIALQARILGKPEAAVQPIQRAILRIDDNGDTFTPIHLTFISLCLETRSFSPARLVLNQDIVNFPPFNVKNGRSSPYLCAMEHTAQALMTPESLFYTGLVYQDHLLYFLYGAMIYMSCQDWERALVYLEIVIITPITRDASMIQVAAYKKWILVNLIWKGRVGLPDNGNNGSMPKTTPSQAVKQYRSLSPSYVYLAEVFENGLKEADASRELVEIAGINSQCFRMDHNYGLVRQVIDAHRYFGTLQLGKVYYGMDIANINRRTSPFPDDYAETGRYVSHLIASRKLNALILRHSENPAEWNVRFFECLVGPLASSEEDQFNELKARNVTAMKWRDHVLKFDRKLGLHKDYIGDAKKKKKEKVEAKEGDEPLLGRDGFDHDEDMMADL